VLVKYLFVVNTVHGLAFLAIEQRCWSATAVTLITGEIECQQTVDFAAIELVVTTDTALLPNR